MKSVHSLHSLSSLPHRPSLLWKVLQNLMNLKGDEIGQEVLYPDDAIVSGELRLNWLVLGQPCAYMLKRVYPALVPGSALHVSAEAKHRAEISLH
jgi:hypothetical protein